MRAKFLADKVSIITGASSGIGRATALELARQGAKVALASRRSELLEALADEIRAMGGEALTLPTDVCEKSQVDQMVEKTIYTWGKLDILVSSSGEYIRCPIEKLTVDHIDQSMAVNFYAGVYCTLAALPHMRSQGYGHFIFITSLDGKKGIPPDAPYVSAKFALTGFAEVLRQELHGTGIRVTNILPGRVDTPMIEDMECHWISAKIPPEDVARTVLRVIRRPRPEVIVPFHAGLIHYVNVFSPQLADWAVRFFRLSGWQKQGSLPRRRIIDIK